MPRRRNASQTRTEGRTCGLGLSARSWHSSSSCTASSRIRTIGLRTSARSSSRRSTTTRSKSHSATLHKAMVTMLWTRQGRDLRPPGLHSVFSSCGLALNAFGPWRLKPESLNFLGESGYMAMRFEEKLRIFRVAAALQTSTSCS